MPSLIIQARCTTIISLNFWYNANVKDDKISFTLKNGSKSFVLDLDLFRSVLQLIYWNVNEEPVEILKETIIREVLQYAGFSGPIYSADNTIINTGIVFLKDLSPTWRYFFIYIVECLGSVAGGLDQVNATVMEIGYAIYKDLSIDFAKKIYDDMIKKVKGKRYAFVNYIRFLSLIFKNILGNEDDNEAMEYFEPEKTKDFRLIPYVEDEVKISPEMAKYVPLFRSYKTDATTSVESKNAPSGQQKIARPIGSASGYLKFTIPVTSLSTQPPLRESSETASEDLQKGASVVQKGQEIKIGRNKAN